MSNDAVWEDHHFFCANHFAVSPVNQVVMFHVFPGLLDEAGAGEGKPTMHVEGYKPMARLGGNTYAQLGSVFDLRRPKVP